MWKNVILLGAFAFLLCACGGARNAKLPDGSKGYSINCNGTDNDWGRLLQPGGGQVRRPVRDRQHQYRGSGQYAHAQYHCEMQEIERVSGRGCVSP